MSRSALRYAHSMLRSMESCWAMLRQCFLSDAQTATLWLTSWPASRVAALQKERMRFTVYHGQRLKNRKAFATCRRSRHACCSKKSKPTLHGVPDVVGHFQEDADESGAKLCRQKAGMFIAREGDGQDRPVGPFWTMFKGTPSIYSGRQAKKFDEMVATRKSPLQVRMCWHTVCFGVQEKSVPCKVLMLSSAPPRWSYSFTKLRSQHNGVHSQTQHSRSMTRAGSCDLPKHWGR